MGRHFYNLAKVAEDLFYELQINLSKLQNAMLYSSKLMEMKENLPGVSSKNIQQSICVCDYPTFIDQ